MDLVAFVPTTDLDRARAFYEGTLGLAVAEVTPFAVVLRCGGTTLRVTKVERLTPQPFTVLGWTVDDVHASLASLDVEAVRYEGIGQDSAGVWTTPDGIRVAWFHDPDGNTLSLSSRHRQA
ncbi:MAG: VOC family protein [Nonomuraea sp.]|nr:VOC family protein [Nonomuraea sp.]